MNTLQPGKNQLGYDCQHCLKSMKKYNTYCNIASHHKVRHIKIKTPKSETKDRLIHIKKLSEKYSYKTLLTSVVFLFPNVQSLTDICNHANKVQTTQLATYLINLHLANTASIQTFLTYLHENKHHFANLQEAKIMKQESHTPYLWNLNITFRHLNNNKIGVVIPESYYLFNIPLRKVVPMLDEFQTIKKEILEYYGYYHEAFTQNKDIKSIMEYSSGRNRYWNTLIPYLEQFRNEIANKLSDALSFNHVNYPVYLLQSPNILHMNPPSRLYHNQELVLDRSYLNKSRVRFYLVKNNQRNFSVDICWKSDFYHEPICQVSKI